jgi:autotransporter-associated beta strand protein
VTTFATGTYNLVNGTLICSNALYFGRNSGAADGHYGIFNQSGGMADLGAIAGRWGEVSLTAGTTKVGYIDGVTGADATFYLGGGRLEPKGATPVVFRSPTVFTGINGDMTFAPASGRSVQFSVLSRSSGVGGFVKEGAGLLYLSNTNSFTGTAAIQEGTCTVAVAGCLTQCTNLLVGADAHLALQRNGAALNTNLWLQVAADGKVHLDYEGEVEVGHLVLNGYEWPGRGRRYGSSAHASGVDSVKDAFFTGTGVLKVDGPRGPDGTLFSLR